jgi:hypothetical protein
MLDTLPTLAWDAIVSRLAADSLKHPGALFNLQKTSKSFRHAVDETPGAWEKAWNALLTKRPSAIVEAKHASGNFKELVRLAGSVGCLACGASRIRKVTWEFHTRMCSDCIYARTISDYRLKNDYALPLHEWKHLPHTTRNMYARPFGTYTLTFYWRASILPILQRVHRVSSFEEYDRRMQARAQARAQAALDKQRRDENERAERTARRACLLTRWCVEEGIPHETLALSATYTRNCRLQAEITLAAFRKLVDRIRDEAANEALATANRAVASCVDDRTCPACVAVGKNVHRLFSARGLADHTAAMHESREAKLRS